MSCLAYAQDMLATSGATGAYSKTRLCKFFAKGRCARGQACTFAHGSSQLQQPPDFFKTRRCAFFAQSGACPAGAECRFAHGIGELRRPHASDSGAGVAAAAAATKAEVSLRDKPPATAARQPQPLPQRSPPEPVQWQPAPYGYVHRLWQSPPHQQTQQLGETPPQPCQSPPQQQQLGEMPPQPCQSPPQQQTQQLPETQLQPQQKPLCAPWGQAPTPKVGLDSAGLDSAMTTPEPCKHLAEAADDVELLMADLEMIKQRLQALESRMFGAAAQPTAPIMGAMCSKGAVTFNPSDLSRQSTEDIWEVVSGFDRAATATAFSDQWVDELEEEEYDYAEDIQARVGAYQQHDEEEVPCEIIIKNTFVHVGPLVTASRSRCRSSSLPASCKGRAGSAGFGA